MDLVGVAILLPILLPLLLLVGCYIRIVSRGPVLFIQERIGRGGAYFSIYKFRTMHVAEKTRDEAHRQYLAERSAGDAPLAKPNYASSLIRGGNLLRKCSLDELPQLLNIWKGDMSLVGPRPDVLHLADYEDWHLRRFEVVPGMTGLWQVSGKNRLSFDRMVELDIQYIDELSPVNDFKIFVKTFRVLLTERNE